MARCKRRILITAFVVLNAIVVFSFWFVFPKYRSFSNEILRTINQNLKVPSTASTSRHKAKLTPSMDLTKFILFWIPMWDSKTFSFGSEGYELFERCEFKTCFATHNRSLISIEKFHAIVFHTAQYNEGKHDRPWCREPDQRYIFANMESPIRAYPDNLERYESFYNWTMTYRFDSDIVRPYGFITRTKTTYKMPNVEFVKNKTDLIAWFASNCHTVNRRDDLYRNLRTFLKIDVYGPCGSLRCPKNLHESSSKCYDLVEKKYKFYLSFENSHCTDYATEKLFRVLQRNVVPIVYGRAAYEKITPPHSVIVADNYSSVEELTKYLLYLDENPEEYLKYFKWKKSHLVEIHELRTVCKLCEMLNDPLEPPKIYKDIFSWWVGNNHSHCKLGDALPKISLPIR